MRNTLSITICCTIALLLVGMSVPANADELVQRIQKDLMTLGYEPGNVDGDMTTDTTIAIAKYQAQHEMPVTGEVSPLLAGIMSAEADKQAAGGATAAETAASAPARTPQELAAAQQACLQQKMAEAQAASKKKRGFGRLLSAVARTAGMAGNNDLARSTSDVYNAAATADDLSAAAKDLGLTDDDIAECQNP